MKGRIRLVNCSIQPCERRYLLQNKTALQPFEIEGESRENTVREEVHTAWPYTPFLGSFIGQWDSTVTSNTWPPMRWVERFPSFNNEFLRDLFTLPQGRILPFTGPYIPFHRSQYSLSQAVNSFLWTVLSRGYTLYILFILT